MNLSLFAIATLVSGLLIGLLPTLVDGIKTPLQTRLKLPEGHVDWFVRLFYLAWLPAMPFAGWLLDVLPNKEILFFGLIGLIFGVAWLALVRTALSLMLNAVFLGLAYSCVTTAAIHFMTAPFFSPDGKDTNIAALNLGFLAVGSGALIGPWLVRAIDAWWGCRQGLLYLSVALIVPAGLTALCDRPDFPAPVADASWDMVLARPDLAILIAVVILAYFAVENSLEFWPENYLKELGHKNSGLQAGMLLFWLAFIATRGAAAWWLYEFPAEDRGWGLTIVLVIASAVVLGNLVGGYEFGSGSLSFWLAGACYGPLLPGFLGMALDIYGRPLPASLLGALLALSGLDTLLMRPLMQAVGRDRPARTVMRVPMFLGLFMVLPLLLLAFMRMRP